MRSLGTSNINGRTGGYAYYSQAGGRSLVRFLLGVCTE